ncbi:MAG TPA: helix-turn-helix transcriptional regulator [Alphaproteobacteria bacterium]|nr:helix-turn-helix transcriptional regulator [Alphaproteobacteria bacterium]
MTSFARRAQLSRFLKNCRARIAPTEAGLPEYSARRRTTGLRREEVAALAGVSVTWYTWLEQGREIQTSADVLERLSRTLRLNCDEREYLFELVQRRPPPLKNDEDDGLDPAISRMIQKLPLPSLLTNIRWDILQWNDLSVKVFRDFSKLAPDDRNILRYLFTAPEYRTDEQEFERLARRWLSNVRLDYARAAGDPAFDALIDELSSICPVFRRVWADPCTVSRNEGINSFFVPKIGNLTLEHTYYSIEGSPCPRLLIFAPYDDESADLLAKLRTQSRMKKNSPQVA